VSRENLLLPYEVQTDGRQSERRDDKLPGDRGGYIVIAAGTLSWGSRSKRTGNVDPWGINEMMLLAN
jgi:hypothetical protein